MNHPPPYIYIFAYSRTVARCSALLYVARARVYHQARELILTNFLTTFSLVYTEEGSIAKTSVKILIITVTPVTL